MRVLGVALFRAGSFLAVVAVLGGLALAVYALGEDVHKLATVGLGGEKESLKRLVLYPVGAAMAGSLAALPGLALNQLGANMLRHRRH